MEVKVRLFGIAKDIVTDTFYRTRLEHNTTVLGLKNDIVKNYPAFSGLKSVLIAVNDEYADDEQTLHENDDIALIPPVSGG